MSSNGKILFVPHGGGPLPLMNDNGHLNMINFLKNISGEFPKPDLVIVVSAHWEKKEVTVTGSENPSMIFDYYGFPEETYHYKFPIPGEPKLASEIAELFTNSGLDCKIDNFRGFDHGVFVPLMLMYPNLDFKCLQVSLLSGLDPAKNILLGRVLGKLMNKNILILGSGLGFHNMNEFFSSNALANEKAIKFNNWLIETVVSQKISNSEKENRLLNWELAPFARFAHPREEHLMPLLVCFGASLEANASPKLVFNDDILGKQTSAFLWE